MGNFVGLFSSFFFLSCGPSYVVDSLSFQFFQKAKKVDAFHLHVTEKLFPPSSDYLLFSSLLVRPALPSLSLSAEVDRRRRVLPIPNFLS